MFAFSLCSTTAVLYYPATHYGSYTQGDDLANQEIPGLSPLAVDLSLSIHDPTGSLLRDSMTPYRRQFVDFLRAAYGIVSEPHLIGALACEAVEVGFDANHIRDHAERVGASELVADGIQRAITRARGRATTILHEISNIPTPDRALLAADFMAKEAYAGKVRRSGAAFYRHPQQVTAMLHDIFSTLETEGHYIEPGFRTAVLAAGLLHDAPEETERSRTYDDPARPDSFSPLLVREVFDQTFSPYGPAVARSLRVMTHHTRLPWSLRYQEYVRFCAKDFIARLVKAVDMRHNHYIDPKPPRDAADADKIDTKQKLYVWGGAELRHPWRPDEAPFDDPAWVGRFFDLLHAIEPENIPNLVREFEVYLYGNGSGAAVA